MITQEELDRMFPIPEPRSEIEALEWKLSTTACKWRVTKDAIYVKEYHDIYHELCALGWNGGIDLEAHLPDRLMPKHYMDQIPKR